jgi:hypothetical protein
MKIDKEVLFGVIVMLVGAFVAADGITAVKFSYTAIGFVMMGFSALLWIEGIGNSIRDDIIDELCIKEE